MIFQYFRPLIFLFVFVAVLVLPWYFSTVLLFALCAYLPFYIEIIFFGFLFDTLYGTGQTALIVSFFVLLLITAIKTRIRF